MKIILVTRNRPILTRQTLGTLEYNSDQEHTVVVVFDGTQEEAKEILGEGLNDIEAPVYVTGKQLGVGGAKNYGVSLFENEVDGLPKPEPDDIIMFTDNDMYYLPHWDTRLTSMFHPPIVQLGGWRHPYHYPTENGWRGFIARIGIAEEVDAATGNCTIIKYSDWQRFGPFDDNAVGPGQSEDFALSRRVAKDGVVASINPPVAIHCGFRDSTGAMANGMLEMARMAATQIEQAGLGGIWLDVPDQGEIHVSSKSKSNFSGINLGSGQRRFDSAQGWINVDHISRPPDQVPDVVCDANDLVSRFGTETQDMVVLHHVLEHFGCGEADNIIKQSWEVLKPGGSLIVIVPDMVALAKRWLAGEIDDYIYMVNVYGAYQGDEGDRHKWGYRPRSLVDYITKLLPNLNPGIQLIPFDWRAIPGADIAPRDWWMLGIEIVK